MLLISCIQLTNGVTNAPQTINLFLAGEPGTFRRGLVFTMERTYRTNQRCIKLMRCGCFCQRMPASFGKYWFEKRIKAYKIQPIPFRQRRIMSEITKQAVDLAKDPASYSHTTYLWVFILSMWGGVVRIMREIKLGGKSWKEILLIFFAELMTSCFAGVVTFYACESAGFERLYTAVMVSAASYMGGRALSILEDIYQGGIRKKGGRR